MLTDKLLSLEWVKCKCSDCLSEGEPADPGARVSIPYCHGTRREQYCQEVSTRVLVIGCILIMHMHTCTYISCKPLKIHKWSCAQRELCYGRGHTNIPYDTMPRHIHRC